MICHKRVYIKQMLFRSPPPNPPMLDMFRLVTLSLERISLASLRQRTFSLGELVRNQLNRNWDERSNDSSTSQETGSDTPANGISWGALGRPDLGSVDGRQVSNGIDHGNGNGSLLGGEIDGLGCPCHDERKCGPNTGSDEAEHDVANDWGLDDRANESANETESKRTSNVPSAVVAAISGEGEDVEADGCDSVDWDGHVLSNSGWVSERLGDGWDEVRDCSGTTVENEEEHEEVGAGIGGSGLESLPVGKNIALARSAGLRIGQDSDGSELTLLEGELGGGGWEIKEDEVGND